MPTQTDPNAPPVLRFPARAGEDPQAAPTLPAILQTGTRAAGGAVDPFLGVVEVQASYPLAAASRGEAAAPRLIADGSQLLALEAADGTTIFIRADRLRAELARLYPEALRDGAIDFSQFRDREAASRGLGDWIWSRVSELRLKPDAIVDAAIEEAKDRALEWLGDKLAAQFAGDDNPLSASWLGAKALMWAIESRLAGEPGLYQWSGDKLGAGDRCRPDDTRLAALGDQPALVFIHGTGSHTQAGFGDLRGPAARTEWGPIARRFGDRVFGFEHRTFSESPIDNALMLAETLPTGARISLVTHSRGGLVGDLLCLDKQGLLADKLVEAYRRAPRPDEVKAEAAQPWKKALREKVAASEQDKLRRLLRLLDEKAFRIERYVRVAAPAAGTALLSDNLEVFLSGLLSLTGKLVGAVAGPAGGAVYSAFSRVVLEIANRRMQPQVVPGIEAMLTDAPLGGLLARASRKQGIAMAVIAGDIEGGSMLKRIGVMFTDWMFFDRADNDLVVDTRSMYAGLAVSNPARYLFDQGTEVNHFSYFRNAATSSAVREWLTADAPDALTTFTPIARLQDGRGADALGLPASRDADKPDSRPVVIFLPGIMGSHLEVIKPGKPAGDGDRVWFDFFSLNWGGLSKIRMGEPNVQPEALFGMFYGDLARHLAATHSVIPFPYDWRQPIQETAKVLAEVVRKALGDNPNQPVRILAHSMGGLVSRAMIDSNADLWQAIVKRPGGRFIMLGTPNNGAHLMVETLLGKSDTMRKLDQIDVPHEMQEVLDIVAGFYGAVQLLPRPAFIDAGESPFDNYYQAAPWAELRAKNRDRWLGDGLCGSIADETFATARALWQREVFRKGLAPEPVDAVRYVFGKAERTPCGVTFENGEVKLRATAEGDGSVSWKSGELANLPLDTHCWVMPVDHGALTGSEEHFEAIVDLLQTGSTARLDRRPLSRGAAAPTWSYDAAPPALPISAEDLAGGLLGTRPPRRKAQAAARRLEVSVRAMDLSFLQHPILCGHYIGDPIAGAEASIDRYLTDSALSQRARLGVYAGELGSAAVVLMPRSAEEVLRGTGKGAVVVGLGELGALSAGNLAETVRAGVLRFLLHAGDCGATVPAHGGGLTLASLLIGYNSTAHITIDDSVMAVVKGVSEANQQFSQTVGDRQALYVSQLIFVELFRDAAITAARAVAGLPERAARDLRQLGTRLEAARELAYGPGTRPRLSVSSPFGYWPRLIVTDAEPEQAPAKDAAPLRLADKLKYVFLSERARAEAIIQQRQPGLIEALVKDAIRGTDYDPSLSQTLFQLMVPLDFKSAARETANLTLVLDGYTANLPWEMLQYGEQPMALDTRMVRQLESTRFRPGIRSTRTNTACVIMDPSTAGYRAQFGGPDWKPDGSSETDRLPPLPGAAREGRAVADILAQAGYEVTQAPPETAALDVLAHLFARPYRVLVICAHGVYRATARDSSARSGVVLSGGILLTAAEIGQMEVVPELVFLNCCHLGKVDATPATAPDRLAYSVARELIEMGVRCVVVAGWAVRDDAACTFASTFFERLARQGDSFGFAVHAARRAVYDAHPDCNTWGAYQAYGDPGFSLSAGPGRGNDKAITLLAPEELLDRLEQMRVQAHHAAADKKDYPAVARHVAALLRSTPPAWADRPEVQYALGALHGEFGADGFEYARAAYERAIAAEDRMGSLPVKAIEQLGNIEARTGEKLGDAEGVALIDRAIGRLRGLLDCTRGQTAMRAGAGESSGISQQAHAERCALLGSAWKRKAVLLARSKAAVWADVKVALEHSRNAYLDGSGSTAGIELDPYPILNRLQLDGLLGVAETMRTRLVELATRCKEIARRRFGSSYDFFDAVMVADAELAIRMIDGTLPTSAEKLVQTYRDAVAHLPMSERQFDSVVRQFQLLAGFYRLRGTKVDIQCADALMKVAQALDPRCDLVVTTPASGDTPDLPHDRAAGSAVGKAKPADSPPTARRAAPRKPGKGGNKK